MTGINDEWLAREQELAEMQEPPIEQRLVTMCNMDEDHAAGLLAMHQVAAVREAADEIDRLRARVAELEGIERRAREALEEEGIIDWCEGAWNWKLVRALIRRILGDDA